MHLCPPHPLYPLMCGRWEHAVVQKWSAFMQTLSDLCVSLFSMEMKVPRSNKSTFEVCNLPDVHSESISCALKYIVHQNICMWEFRETSCLVKQFLSVVFTQELPLERGEEDGYLLYLVLLSFFISVTIAVLLVLLIACRRCCEGERSFARWDKSL